MLLILLLVVSVVERFDNLLLLVRLFMFERVIERVRGEDCVFGDRFVFDLFVCNDIGLVWIFIV